MSPAVSSVLPQNLCAVIEGSWDLLCELSGTQCGQLRGSFWLSLRSCPHAAAASWPLVILVLTGYPLASNALRKANTAFLLGRVKSASSTAFQGMRFT